MSDKHATLTQAQQNVLTLLQQSDGISYGEIADVLSTSESTARDHVAALRSAGFSIGEDREEGRKVFYHRPSNSEYPINPAVPNGDLRSKAAITKEAKESVRELIQYLDRELRHSQPAMPDDGLTVRNSHEDMVVHRSDDHIGALYKDEHGNRTFDAETGIERVREVSEKTFRLKHRQEKAGIDFDTVHILLGGDHVHGVGIHDDQPWETELSVPEQLSVAYDIYTEFIDRASSEFDSVQVVCQRGNHGELRGNGMGPDDNLDDAFFMMLDKFVRDQEFGNVKFVQSAGGNFTNFRMRVRPEEDRETARKLDMDVDELPTELESGHRGHLRHGQNSLKHIGTSSGERRWGNWLDKHEFDIGYRGHYHQWRIEPIYSRPVIMSGAIVPPADFEESLAEWDEPAATIHGVSDERPMTWFYQLDFE